MMLLMLVLIDMQIYLKCAHNAVGK